MNYKKIVQGTLASFALLLNCGDAFADLDNAGNEFILSVLPNYTTPNVEVHLTSTVATTVSVEYPVNAPTFTTSVAVNPGAITIVSLPSDAAQAWSNGVIQNNSFRLSAPAEFVAYTVDRAPYSSDAALALPVDALNNEYIVNTYTEAFGNAEASITAAFDNTTVTITPSNNLGSGQLAGVPFDIVLNRGEGFMILAAAGLPGGLSGSIITSDKPVSVTNGNYCTQVPNGTAYCDHIYEQSQPVATWGNSVLAVNLANRDGGTIYRVVSAEDNNVITLDGASQGTINRGQYLELGPIPDAHVIAGSKPILVSQFMTGSTSPGANQGDPAMANLIPSEQFLSDYTFSTVGGGQFASHYLTIIALNSDVGFLTLDGSVVNSSEFTAIPATSYSYARISVNEGTHLTSSTNGHGVYLAGYNQDDSYLYAGGARFAFINPVGDENSPLCSLILSDNPALYNGSGTDNRPTEDVNLNGILDAGEDLNGNGKIDKDKGVFFVELLPGFSNLSLNVPSFVPGAGVVNYTLSLVDPNLPASGTVRVTDGAGNTCTSVLGGGAICDSTDLTPILFSMDGAANDAYKTGLAIRKYLKKYSGVAGAGNKLVNQLNSLYLANWNLTWTELPKTELTNCSNAEMCVNVNSINEVEDYNSTALSMYNINKTLLKKLKNSGTPASLIQTLREQNQSILSEAQALSLEIPAETLSCPDYEMFK
jgi:hypothetical protein